MIFNFYKNACVLCISFNSMQNFKTNKNESVEIVIEKKIICYVIKPIIAEAVTKKKIYNLRKQE